MISFKLLFKPNLSILPFRIINYLNNKRKKQLFFLLIIMLVSSLSELISLYSIFPILVFVSNSKSFENEGFLAGNQVIFSNILENIGLGYSSLIFIFIVIFTTFIRLFNTYLNYRIASRISVDISNLAFKKILHQEYLFFVNNNSAEIISTLVIKANMAVYSISLFFQMITGIFVSFAIITALLTINFKISVLTGFLFVFFYLIISLFTFKTLRKNGQIIAKRSDEKIKILQESLGGIRDLILDSNQAVFQTLFKKVDFDIRRREANNQFLAFFPRYSLEGIAIIILISVLVISTNYNPQNFGSIIALAGTLALGTQRLLPSMQLIYGSWASIQSQKRGVIEILKILDMKENNKNKIKSVKSLFLGKSIKLQNINYAFKKDQPILKGINLEIKKGDCIGIIGKTGSGKSTFLDILMGLIFPREGNIYVDNKEISKSFNSISWRKSISHVPQNIFLSDASIGENIAFGVEPYLIDKDKLIKAAEAANLLSFINSKPEKFRTIIGERGIQLSGGQRQRIGIARALYKGGEILILDEATSSLDTQTENSIMESIFSLASKKTIIIVAHRLSTLRKCDKIYKLDNGYLEQIDKKEIFKI